MVKSYYITTPVHARELHHAWHGIDLGNGKLLVAVDWHNAAHEQGWTDHADVVSLPHPVWDAGVKLSDEHRTHLSEKFGCQDGDTILHLIRKVCCEHPIMK